MSLVPWNVDWLSANSQRKYPLSETATGFDVSGALQLPNDFLVDLVFTVPAEEATDPAGFHILYVTVFGSGVVLTLGYNGAEAGIVSIPRAAHTRNKSYRVIGQGDFDDADGTATVGSLDTLLTVGAGTYTFDANGGRIEPTTIHPDIRGVTSIRTQSGTEVSVALYGDIVLQAGNNIKFTVDEATGHIRIDCIASAQSLAETCDCGDAALLLGPIRTINGVGPDANGNFTLQTDACIQVTSLGSGLKLADVCSTPCCGCSELDVIKTAMVLLSERENTLRERIQQLDTAIQQALSNVMISKIGTSGA